MGSGTPLIDGLTTADVAVSSPQPGYVAVGASYIYRPMIGNQLQLFGLGPSVAVNIPLRATVRMRAL